MLKESQTAPGGDAPAGSAVPAVLVGRRQELLEAGLRLFSERPYDELSIDDIAAAAGVAKGLLYYYFGSKRGYYVAVIEESARELRARATFDASLAPSERLSLGLDAYLTYAEQHSPGFITMLVAGVGSDVQVRVIRERERAAFLLLILEGIEATPTPALTLALEGWFSFVEGVTLAWLGRRDLERDAVRDLCISALEGAVIAAGEVDPSVAGLERHVRG